MAAWQNLKAVTHDETSPGEGHHIPEWFWRIEGANTSQSAQNPGENDSAVKIDEVLHDGRC